MEMTGYDYIIYSNKSVFLLEEEIIKQVKRIWTDCIYDREEIGVGECLELFFSKDKLMYEDDIGYVLDKNGEGCFLLIGKKFDGLDYIVNHLDEERNTTHESRFILDDLWEYTLVLPEKIEISDFTKRIYQIIIDFLINKTTSTERLPIQKSVQSFIGM